MKIRLDDLSIKVVDEKYKGNEVYIHIEYNQISQNEVKYYIYGSLGQDEKICCFYFKMIYSVTSDKTINKSIIEEAIENITDSTLEVIGYIDTLIRGKDDLLLCMN